MGHLSLLRDFLPIGRGEAHIDENEFLTEILRTVLWGEVEESLLLFGITDNATAICGSQKDVPGVVLVCASRGRCADG